MKDNSFKDFILEQLGDKHVRIRAMFGGYGLYWDGKFFAVMDEDRLYFKVDDVTRPKYEKLGMKPFAPTKDQVMKKYYEVPTEIIENPKELIAWAIEASSR